MVHETGEWSGYIGPSADLYGKICQFFCLTSVVGVRAGTRQAHVLKGLKFATYYNGSLCGDVQSECSPFESHAEYSLARLSILS